MNYDIPKNFKAKSIVNVKSFYEVTKKDYTNNDWGRPFENTDWGGHITFSGSANALATGSYYTWTPSQRPIPEVENEQQHMGNVMAEITFPKPKEENRG